MPPDPLPTFVPTAIVRQPLRLECNDRGHCRASTDHYFGTGKIEFGLNYDRETGALIDKRTSFSLTLKRFAWSASFLRESLDPLVRTVSRVLDDGNELLVYSEYTGGDIYGSTPVLVDRQRMRVLVDKRPGRYVMRFYSGTTIDAANLLAEGQFELT